LIIYTWVCLDIFLICCCGAGSVQLDGIAETSPVKNPSSIATQLSRSYLDIEREQAGMTPEKGDGEPTVHRKSRTRRSTTLRKSLAWDKAFFTDEGNVLVHVKNYVPHVLLQGTCHSGAWTHRV
jgi:hypothetical protein